MGGRENIYRDGEALERYIERSIGRLDTNDRETARCYFGELTSNGVGLRRIHKIATILSRIAEKVKKPLADLEGEDVKHYCAWLERSDYTDWSRHDHRLVLRGYMRWLGKGEAVAWLKVKPPKNGTLPEEVLTEEDVKKLVQSAYTLRDRTMVMSMYESGCRIGEFLPLRLKHLQFDRHGALLLIPEGKTGRRRVRLVASALPLQRWLDEHPDKDDPEAYLWCQIPAPYHPADRVKRRHLSYGFVSRLLRELSKKAGVKKRVNPHSFRHARATFMARHLKEPEMREFFGWGKDSEMPSVYVHLSGRDVDDSVLSIYGIKETDKERGSELKAFECPRCREKNDSTRLYCGRCGLPFEEGVMKEERLEELVVELLKAVSETNPEIKQRFAELVKKKGAGDLFA